MKENCFSFQQKLRTSSETTPSQSNEGDQTKLPKQYRFHPIINHEFTGSIRISE